MLAIPKQIHEYVDLVHGLRELVHEGQVATPLSDDAVGKIMQLVALVQSSCTEAAEVKALSETFNQQAVFMSSFVRAYNDKMVAAVPPAVCGEACHFCACTATTCHDHTKHAHSHAHNHGHTHTEHHIHHHHCGHKEATPPPPPPPPTVTVMSPVVATPLPELHHCDSFPHERCGAGCRRCDAELRAELKAEYKKRTAELADKYERKYAFLKDQYVKREREIKSKYDVALESRIEKYNDLVEKFNELKDRYESLRAHHASLL